MKPLPATALLLALFLNGAALSAQAARWEGERLPAQGLDAGDHFGAAVALDGNLLAVGAHLSDASGKDSGAVYLYKKVDESWVSFERHPRIVGSAGDQLGFDLAISGQTLLVGAPFARIGGVLCGAVRRFAVDASTGTVAPQGDLQLPAGACQAGAEIGSAVALSGDIVAVGARGAEERAGRIYVAVGGAGLQALPAAGLRAGDELGQSLSTYVTDGGTDLVAGAPAANGGALLAGMVRVYRFAAGGWAEEVVLSGRPDRDAAFGYSVAIRGDRLVVGAPLEGPTDAGAVHLFTRTPTGWSQTAVVPGRGAGDQLGVSVAISAEGIFAGARRAGSNRSGSVLEIAAGGSLGAPIQPPNPRAGSEFGFAVAAQGETLVIGAFLEDIPRTDAGAAYVFRKDEEDTVTQTVEVRLIPGVRSVRESAGSVPLLVTVTTSDGLATSSAVTVRLSVCPSPDVCTALPGSDFASPPASLDIDKGKASGTSYELTRLTIVDDSLCEGLETFTVHLSGPGSADGGALRVRILDDDTGAIVSDAGLLLTTEAGGTAGLDLRLFTPPAAPVTVTVESLDPSEGTVPPGALTFSSAGAPQSVTVTGQDDSFCDGDQSYELRVTTTSADRCYNGLEATFSARNRDDDLTCVSVEKTVCVDPDGTVVYTLLLSNGGTVAQEDLPGPELSDPLPDEVSVVAASADSGVATMDPVGNNVVWNGQIPPGERTVSITIVTALDPVAPETEVINQATVTYDRDARGTLETVRSDDDPESGPPENPTVFRVGETPCASPPPP